MGGGIRLYAQEIPSVFLALGQGAKSFGPEPGLEFDTTVTVQRPLRAPYLPARRRAARSFGAVPFGSGLRRGLRRYQIRPQPTTGLVELVVVGRARRGGGGASATGASASSSSSTRLSSSSS